MCQDCGQVHAQGFCWACNKMIGIIKEHVSYDCQQDILFNIDHRSHSILRVVCADCLPSFYRTRWQQAERRAP